MMRRHAMIAMFGAFLALGGGCDVSNESVRFRSVEATQYSRDDLRVLVWRTPPSELVPALTAVNRRDHPFLAEMLLVELRGALQKGEDERAAALVEALSWCGWGVVAKVRAAVVELAAQGRNHQLAAIEILRRMGDGTRSGPLFSLTEADDPEVARSARAAVTDLFGTVEASTESEILTGSTPWVMRRVAALRSFELTDGETKARLKLRKSLSTCPPSRRVDMYRILVRSCMLPLEEFPGQAEMERIGHRSYLRERMGHAGEDLLLNMGDYRPKYLLALSSRLLAESSPEERGTFWHLLARPLASWDAVAQELYDEWVRRDFREVEAFYFLAASSQREIESRSPRELELAAELDWEARFEALELEGAGPHEKHIFHTYVKYVARVTGADGREIHPLHRWGDPCVVDTVALREALSREYVWDPASGRFDPKE